MSIFQHLGCLVLATEASSSPLQRAEGQGWGSYSLIILYSSTLASNPRGAEQAGPGMVYLPFFQSPFQFLRVKHQLWEQQDQ